MQPSFTEDRAARHIFERGPSKFSVKFGIIWWSTLEDEDFQMIFQKSAKLQSVQKNLVFQSIILAHSNKIWEVMVILSNFYFLITAAMFEGGWTYWTQFPEDQPRTILSKFA